MKFRELKFIDLDVTLRRVTEIDKFIQLLTYFKELKESDIVNFNKLSQEDTGVEKNRIFYVAKNYLNISKIHCVSLKIKEEVVTLLKDLCPSCFEYPVKFIPLTVSVLKSGFAEVDDEAYVNETIPNEIEPVLKYNPEYNILHVNSESVDLKLLFGKISIKTKPRNKNLVFLNL